MCRLTFRDESQFRSKISVLSREPDISLFFQSPLLHQIHIQSLLDFTSASLQHPVLETVIVVSFSNWHIQMEVMPQEQSVHPLQISISSAALAPALVTPPVSAQEPQHSVHGAFDFGEWITPFCLTLLLFPINPIWLFEHQCKWWVLEVCVLSLM